MIDRSFFLLHRSIPRVVVALLLALAITLPARAQMLYTAGSGDQFGTINVATGAYTAIGTGFTTYNGTNTQLAGVAYAANGNLYGLDYTGRFFQINRNSGVLTLVGTATGLSTSAQDVTIGNTSDGTIYGLSAASSSSAPTIYRIDPATGATTLLGSSGSIYFDGGLGGDGSNNLFATGGYGGSQTFKLSTSTGAATALSANSGAGTTLALGFTNANLYALGSGGGIYTIDTTTGLATDTGVTYNTTTAGISQGVAPLVFTATVPEPSTWSLLGMSGIVTAFSFSRRRSRAAV